MLLYVCQLNPVIGNIKQNTNKIIQCLKKNKADIVVFPEMAITGYPPDDLLLYPNFLHQTKQALKEIIPHTKNCLTIIGTIRENPLGKEKKLLNSAAIIANGKLIGFKDKTLLPTYDVFDERRYFSPGEKQKIWKYKNKRIGVLICEDIWEHAKNSIDVGYGRDPVSEIKKLKPDIIISISASPYYFQKEKIVRDVYKKTSISVKCPLIICNQAGGNDQLIFSGFSRIIVNGKTASSAKGFQEDFLFVDLDNIKYNPIPPYDPYENLYTALVVGVKDYFSKLNMKKACLGLSGGIDSAITLCIAKDALGANNVLAINMPSQFSSLGGKKDAKQLANNLKIKFLQIPIDNIYQQFLLLLNPYFKNKPFDTTEENIQARIRGMILMALSNKLGYLVLSTGNKSELAMGYCTLYGDMCGGLNVLGDVSKKQIYKLASWINKKQKIIPPTIISRAPSAELRKNQKDQDSLPPYDIVDTVLADYVEEHMDIEKIANKRRIDYELVKDLVTRIHRAEYKRRQGAPSIKVTKRSFGRGRVFPIVQGWI
jgi:NAD+ synthase (glutamine-hydrolysing)